MYECLKKTVIFTKKKFIILFLMFAIPNCYNLYRIYKRVYDTTVYFIYIKIVYCQGDMFRPSLGHLQVLKENRSKIK